jgi:hypothetical protein
MADNTNAETPLQDESSNGVDSTALDNLLRAFSGRSDDLLEQFEAAAKSLPSKMLQLNSALNGFSTEDIIGVMIILRKEDVNLMFQVSAFHEHSAQFTATNIVDKKDTISFSRRLMRRAPITFYEYLSEFTTSAQVRALPINDVLPKGAMYVNLSPNHPIEIAIVDSEGCEINRAISSDVFGVALDSSASGSAATAAVREHRPPVDPMKHQAIQKLAPATSAIFTGKLDHLTMNFQYVYDCIVNGGFEVRDGVEQSGLLDMVMDVCIPKVGCVLIMSGAWIGLYHFRSLGRNSYYLDKEHATTACPRDEWENWSIETVEECWNNCLRLYNRLYLVSSEYRVMWDGVWMVIRSCKLHKERFFPALKYGVVLYQILDNIARNLFLMIGRQDLTSEQLSDAMQKCQVSDTDPAFLLIYNQLEKEHDRSLRALVIEDDDNSENPSKKKARLDKKKSDKKKGDKDTTGKKGDGPCFQFLSQAGCSKSNCRFKHKAVTDLPTDKKARVREMMNTRSLIIDESKF